MTFSRWGWGTAGLFINIISVQVWRPLSANAWIWGASFTMCTSEEISKTDGWRCVICWHLTLLFSWKNDLMFIFHVETKWLNWWDRSSKHHDVLSWCHIRPFTSEQVGGQKKRTGASPGPLTGLNTFSELYVGGYKEYTPELLPAGSRFQKSFQGEARVVFLLLSFLMSWFVLSARDEIDLCYLHLLSSEVWREQDVWFAILLVFWWEHTNLDMHAAIHHTTLIKQMGFF